MSHGLAIVGPLPPPIGGVAVHLERLLPYLDRAEIDYFVYNTAGPAEVPGRAISVAKCKRRWFLMYLLRGKEPIAYFVADQWQVWAAVWFLSRLRGKKVIIGLRSEAIRMTCESHGRLFRRLIARSLEEATRIIAVSDHIRDWLSTIGDFANKTVVIPGFIPPTYSSEDDAAVPQHIRTFCAEHDPVILANGAPVLCDGETDLYGIDMTIALADHLRRSYPKIGVVWFLLDFIRSIPEYGEQMRREVKERGLDGHWCFAKPQEVFYPAYKLADVFVRPTCRDGDANSIREALHFGIPAVASDATPRPEGTRVFRSRDQEDYERVLHQMLENLPAERVRLQHRESESAADRIVALFREVTGRSTGR